MDKVHKEGVSAKPFSARVKRFADSLAFLALSLVAGILASLVTYEIRKAIIRLDTPIVDISKTLKNINILSMLAALSFLLIFGLVVLTPIIWRRLKNVG